VRVCARVCECVCGCAEVTDADGVIDVAVVAAGGASWFIDSFVVLICSSMCSFTIRSRINDVRHSFILLSYIPLCIHPYRLSFIHAGGCACVFACVNMCVAVMVRLV
jgi:hypothetical protein